MWIGAIMTAALGLATSQSVDLSMDPPSPAGLRQSTTSEDEAPFGLTLRGEAVWTFAWGTASARNSFTRYERGEDLDVRGDFGLLRGAALADTAAAFRFAHRHRVTLHSFFGELSAHTVLDRTFEYNDGVFDAGEHARTKIEVDLLDIDYAFRLLERPFLSLWAGAGGRRSHLNVGVRSSTLDRAGSMEENTAFHPTLNLGLAYGFAPRLEVALELRGSPVAIPAFFSHASLGRFLDARTAVQWTIWDGVKLELGGRFLWVWQRWRGRESDGHHAVNYVNLRLAGPSLGIEISF